MINKLGMDKRGMVMPERWICSSPAALEASDFCVLLSRSSPGILLTLIRPSLKTKAEVGKALNLH